MTALNGAIAQLVERVLCKHEVVGSIPSGSTILRPAGFGWQAIAFILRSLGVGGRDQDQDFAGSLTQESGRIDIVNEGSSRTLPSVGQVGPEEDIKIV